MKPFHEQTILGRTGLKVGRLGISSSFGAPAEAFEEAFERGCNYFTWGTFIRGKSAEMANAIRHIVKNGHRDKLVIAMFSYAHQANLTSHFLEKGLRKLGIDAIDVLLLGYYSTAPRKGIIEGAMKLKEQGKIRYIGLSSHNRNLFPTLSREGNINVFHIRYNAAHRGAETESFPFLSGPDSDRAGVVSFTATRWRRLLKERKMPSGEQPLTASDCYRFVLSNPAVDICMMGAKNRREMLENLAVLDSDPLTEPELERVRKIGDWVHGK